MLISPPKPVLYTLFYGLPKKLGCDLIDSGPFSALAVADISGLILVQLAATEPTQGLTSAIMVLFNNYR